MLHISLAWKKNRFPVSESKNKKPGAGEENPLRRPVMYMRDTYFPVKPDSYSAQYRKLPPPKNSLRSEVPGKSASGK